MFVRVIEAGSFSAAARDLNMGQPAVSKTIASLEDRLGVRLLTRSTRKLSPTEAGTAFYERAIRAIGEANEAEAAAQGAGAGLEGRLRVSAPVTFSRLHLVPKLGSFLDAHPKVQLDLVMDDRVVDLVAENIDVALRLGVLTDSAMKARKLGQADRLVVATPDLPRATEGFRALRRIYSNTTALFMARARADRNGSFGVALRRHRCTSRRA